MKSLENTLSEIQQYQLGKYFINEKRIWKCVNMSFVNDYCNNLIVVLSRADMLAVRYDELDVFANESFNVSIIVAFLPLLLNLSWCSNTFTVFGVILTKLLMSYQKLVEIVALSLIINLVLGSCLLATYFMPLCCTEVVKKEKTLIIN